MVQFPNCKINLGLSIIRKRDDGFHDIETVFYPLLQVRDAIEIIQTSNLKSQISNPDFSCSGLHVDGNDENNLCVKAYHLLKKDFPQLPAVKIHLHKSVPTGAGLGGGSADGVFTLKLLNEKFQLNLSSNQLMNYALQLGSDCPFFILNKPCFASSRGEILHGLNIDLSDYYFIIVNPNIHINTGWAFSQINPHQPKKSVLEIIQQPAETWSKELINDFEEPVSKIHPEINSIKQKLYESGAVYASMTGSGSTVFGIFKTKPGKIKSPNSYMYLQIKNTAD